AATSSSNTVVSFVYSGKRKSNDAPRPAASITLERYPSISGGDNDKGNDSEIDADDHQADSSYIPVATFIHNRKRKSKATPAPASPFKRTRPMLASPYGGNYGSSSSSASFATSKQQFDVETGSLSPSSNQDESDNLLPVQQSSHKQTPNKRRSPSSDPHRPFVCHHPNCGRAFNRLFNLRSHVRTHDPNSERPFICEEDDCKKAFTRKHDLQRHQTSVHQGQRRYVCDTCKKSFSRQDGLRRHYRRERIDTLRLEFTGQPVGNSTITRPATLDDQHVIKKSLSHDDIQASNGLDPSSITTPNPTFPWNPGDQTISPPQSLSDLVHNQTSASGSCSPATHISLRRMA
ncbi:hypothetical protein BGZ89_006854, partial [Linnemannia elongata]